MPLFSDTMIQFISDIPSQTTSMDELIMSITKNIPPLAKELLIGKVDLQIDTCASFFEPKGISNYCMLYSSCDGNGSYCIEDTFQLPHNSGSIQIHSYSTLQNTWTSTQEAEIHTFHKCVFIICSRAKVIGMLSKVTTHDSLTGLINFVGLQEAVLPIMKSGSILDYTGIFLNLRNFKFVNQYYGNKAGDDALRKYAHRLQNNLEKDEFVARPGGDNFFVLLKTAHLDSFLQFITSVRVNISLGNTIQGIDLPARAGICSAHEKEGIFDIINKASIALSFAKRSVQKSQLWFQEEMIERSIKQKSILDMFPLAIEKEEFKVFYQPKVCSTDYTMCGCEALTRWDKKGEILPPEEFIQVLEQNGNICMLDFYVLEHVCKDIRRWLDSGISPVRVSVNFSKLHLHNRRLSHDILTILAKYHIEPCYIEIELTESSAYDDFHALSDFVTTMEQAGVHISIDDFGTGYSSLNLLKNLPIHVVKLDKSFLGEVHQQKKAEVIIIKAIMNMVSELNIDVVCEGVETKDQVTFLSSLGTPVFQGKYFDEPLCALDFEKKLTDKQYIR